MDFWLLKCIRPLELGTTKNAQLSKYQHSASQSISYCANQILAFSHPIQINGSVDDHSKDCHHNLWNAVIPSMLSLNKGHLFTLNIRLVSVKSLNIAIYNLIMKWNIAQGLSVGFCNGIYSVLLCPRRLHTYMVRVPVRLFRQTFQEAVWPIGVA